MRGEPEMPHATVWRRAPAGVRRDEFRAILLLQNNI